MCRIGQQWKGERIMREEGSIQSCQVYGTATEDMDALTFGSNVLLRFVTIYPMIIMIITRMKTYLNLQHD